MSSSADVTNGLVLHYTFDTDSGTNVYDQSGNGHNGYTVGTVAYGDGITGKAPRFTSRNTYVVSPSSGLNMNGWTTFSASAWVRIDGGTRYGVVMERGGLTEPLWDGFSLKTGGSYGGSWYTGFLCLRTNLNQLAIVYSSAFGSGVNPQPQRGEWYHIAGVYDGTNINYYVNGGLDSSVALGAVGTPVYDSPSTKMVIGNSAHGACINWYDAFFNGSIDEVRIYDRALTVDELAELSGTTPEEEIDEELVLYFTFDMDGGATVSDQSGRGNDGTVSGATWVSNALCGGGMSFDGSSDFIGVVDSTSLWVQANTIAAWIKPDVGFTGGLFVAKQEPGLGGGMSLGYGEQVGAANYRLMDGSTQGVYQVVDNVVLETGKWHFVVGTYDGSDRKLYVDGRLKASGDGSVQISHTNTSLCIGGDPVNAGWVDGVLDEVRVYNYALSQVEIAQLYGKAISEGLMVYYTFDSDSGTNVYDQSGNGNHGYTVGAVSYETTEFGKSPRISSKDTYIVSPSQNLNVNGWTQLTAAVWINIKGGTRYGKVLERGGYTTQIWDGFGIKAGGSYGGSWYPGDFVIQTNDADNLTCYPSTFGSGALPQPEQNRWYHLAGVYDGTNVRYYVDGQQEGFSPGVAGRPIYDSPGTVMVIGNSAHSDWINWSDAFFNGLVDEVRVYNRALPPEEVASLAGTVVDTNDGGGLVVYFDFDEDEGGTVTDKSGEGNHGIASGGPTWTNAGVNGGAMSFDGDNDRIAFSTADICHYAGTYSFWMYSRENPPVVGGSEVFCHWNAGNRLYWICRSFGGDTNKYMLGLADDPIWTQVDYVENEWHHFAVVYDLGSWKVYQDTVLVDQGTYSGNIVFGPQVYLGGYDAGRYYNGLIDEVRVYSYPLSHDEVKGLYYNQAPEPSLTLSQTNGIAPFRPQVDLSCVDSDGHGVRWELDVDGNGSYELTGTEFGSVLLEYSEPGTFITSLRVIDNLGREGTAAVAVTVVGAPPVADIEASPVSGVAPLTVQFSATNSASTPGRSLVAYEWDWNGDGTYDLLSASNVVQHVYRQAGTNKVVLRVTDDQGLSDSSATTVQVSVALSPPTVEMGAEPVAGDAPLDVAFAVVASDDGWINEYRWDFDGDGETDLTSTTNFAQHTFVEPGSYVITVTAVDNDGSAGNTTHTIRVTEPSNLRVWISQPRREAHIWGGVVSLHANTAPGNATGSVQFQYVQSGGTNWVNIGSLLLPPARSFRTTWDVTGLVDGQGYDLRVVGTDTNSSVVYSQIRTVTVDSTPLEEDDGVEESNDGTHRAKHRLSSSKGARLRAHDGTGVVVPYGTVASNATVQIDLINANTNDLVGAASGRRSIERNRNVTIEGDPGLKMAITIDIPYSDEDDDGFVDGTCISERTLRGYWYDAGQARWRRSLSCEILAEENIVRIRTYHLTEFGVFGNANVLAPINGGILLSSTSDAGTGNDAAMLTDDNTVSYWKSEATPTIQEFVYCFTNYCGAVFDEAVLHNYGEGSNLYSADFEIHISMDGTNYVGLTNGTLLAQEGPQTFTFGTATSRWVKFVISSGSTNTAWELSEFSLTGTLTNDADADLMLDSWEMQYFGMFDRVGTNDFDGDGLTDAEEEGLVGADPTKWDTDGDGASDGHEVAAGTGLTNDTEKFQIEAFVVAPDSDLVLEWQTVTGKAYAVQTCADLMLVWTNVSEVAYTNSPGTGSPLLYTNKEALLSGRFFRVKVVGE